ncbi:hypothetical protein [uncultured Tateyamaria sp.]|uniref:hypothetical protein n=1 Tax=uncultured Tateyamaria sp. TaxID=455651 RepID=UPI00261A0664|nr:hypothetical protein [uncultured Tateyamaria sp.]
MSRSHLTNVQAAALIDAHKSINHGGLKEVSAHRGTVWVGQHPDCTQEHSSIVVTWLRYACLLDRSGRKPTRTAIITNEGLLEIDMLGAEA